MYYIEKSDKPKLLDKMLNIVRIEDNKIFLPINEDVDNYKKTIKLAEKTCKKLNKTNSNKIVLSKDLYKNDLYKNILYENNYDIVDGKWLFEAIVCKVLDYIVCKMKIKKEDTAISVLVNNLSDYTLQNIKKLSNEYKTLNIVTNHIEKFKNVEKNIYEESGLMITVTNNKKKSLTKSKIILNIDFPTELLNKYNIYEQAIIVNICGKIKINKKRFNGILVNDYEISVNESSIQDYIGNTSIYNTKHLYEAEFYKNIPFQDFESKIKNDMLEIKELYGRNGNVFD